MTNEEWPRIKRLIEAVAVERKPLDDAAYFRHLKAFSAESIEDAVVSLQGSRFTPKVSEIVNAMPARSVADDRDARLREECAAYEAWRKAGKTGNGWVAKLRAERAARSTGRAV